MMKYEDLKILDELREKGSITEEEYQREKARLLNDTPNPNSFGAGKPLFGLQENTYLMLMHLTQLMGIFVPLLGFIIPVIMWFTNKETNPQVDLHGKNVLNFTISFLIYTAILSITIVGIPLLILVGILYLIFVIMAALRANNGIYWKYPLSIEFIK
ncbi:MAG TPA: hypothetical protein DEG28_07010 [Porphyromonadaceae bacterium]|nr:hypothetical protein [Porphyromonadaceae bacterium]